MKKIISLALGSLFVWGFTQVAYARDVTGLVVQHTDLDEQVADGCHRYCRGNRRRGTLDRVVVNRLDAEHYLVRMWASLKNHHHVDTVIGGGFASYQYTIGVMAEGVLNGNSCILTVNNIRVTGDDLGIAGNLSGERGKQHHINNCRIFL